MLIFAGWFRRTAFGRGASACLRSSVTLVEPDGGSASWLTAESPVRPLALLPVDARYEPAL
jgi:hypothetical protein